MRKNKIVAAAASLVVGSGLLLGSQYVTALETNDLGNTQGFALLSPEEMSWCFDGLSVTQPPSDSLCYGTFLNQNLGNQGNAPGQVGIRNAFNPPMGSASPP